ncbi:hypothetical protein KGY79_03645 [Candidatus Bipolaricaulota bacterium]|nr:hypothetical protein [Candidatus Bipolaricaulota bacterium]
MTKEVRQKPNSTGVSGSDAVHGSNHCCPRCGGEVVPTTQGVSASFPSPALRRLVCSESDCNYVKYVKLNSTGFASEVGSAINRGDQGA